jgi:hypothetical protein
VILTSECSHRLERVMNSTRSGGRPCGASTC